MKKGLKKIVATILTAAMAMSITVPAFAEKSLNEESQKQAFIREELNDTTLSKESIDFLEKNGIYDLQEHFDTIAYTNEENLYAGILDEDILALKRAAEANNFTEEQIQKYVEGLLNSSPTIVLESQMVSPMAADRKDRDGVGYEVQSKDGYTQATSYATLPKRNINNLADIAYVFYTVYVNGGTCMDFGVRGGMYSWVTTYLPVVSGDGTKINKNDGEKIYFNINVEKNGVLRCRILDANNFSNVLCDTLYQMTGVAKNNMIFNKQITFCNNYQTFNSGCKISNGGFDNSYIYTTTGYSKMNSTNTLSNRCGRFGIVGIDGSREMVTVNNANTSEWDKEDVTITFNLK